MFGVLRILGTVERDRVGGCYDRLNELVADEGDRVTLATIAVISALEYAKWRHAEDDWRSNHNFLTKYYDRLSARPSFVETAPNF